MSADKSKYNTKQRKILLGFLETHPDEMLCVNRIAESLAEMGISLSAIYRNLSELEAEGKVRRVSAEGSRQVFYRYVATDQCAGHLHMSCSECGKTFHMDIPLSEQLIEKVAKGSDFEIDSSATMLYGICGECKKCGKNPDKRDGGKRAR